MNSRTLFVLPLLMLFVLIKADAQTGWKWAVKDSFSHFTDPPFQNTRFEALGPNGSVYTVVSTGGQALAPVLAGTETHCGPFTIVDSSNNAQMVVSRIDSNGNYMWVANTQHGNVSVLDIASDTAGNVYVVGVFDSTKVSFGSVILYNPYAFRCMYFIAKYSPIGTLLWAKDVVQTTGGGVGDIKFTSGCISVDGAGSVYVSGVFVDSTITIGSSTVLNTYWDNKLFLAKFNSSGVALWAKGFGTVQNNQNSERVLATSAGHLYMTGVYNNGSITFGSTTLTSASGYGIFLTKMDTSGNTIWAKSADCILTDVIQHMTTDAQENAYIVGSFNNNTITFGSHTLTNYSPGMSDGFFVKYDPAGNLRWANQAGGIQPDRAFSAAVDIKGNVWLTGNMGGGFYSAGYVLNFGSYAYIEPAGLTNDDPIFIARYDTAGTLISVSSTTGGGLDQANIMVDNRGNFYISADWYLATEVFGSDYIVPDAFEKQSFVAKYRYDGTFYTLGTPDANKISDISVYPNPACSELHIAADDKIRSITISDIVGRVLIKEEHDSYLVSLDVSGLSKGMYLLRINDNEVRKVVKG